MNLKIDGIWCKTKTEFNRHVKEEDYDAIINYSDIYSRLLKSDPYGNEPSDIIVTLHIEKMFRCLLEKESEEHRAAYLFKTLNQETVENFRDFISILSESYQLDLTIINRCDYPEIGVLSKFDNVKFIDND
jgi:hypothetical protein